MDTDEASTFPNWKSETSSILIVPCKVPCGPTVFLSHNSLEIFRLFFTSSLLSLISEQTNLYAKQVLTPEAFDKYEPITPREIEAYFGFMILMGINQLPTLYDYWKTDSTYHYSPIADRIPRDRFIEISRFLHFTNNNDYMYQRTDPNYDRLWKIRPVITAISEKFLNTYNPHNTVSIDEAMIPFKGRCSLKQYLPLKPVKRGIKVWVRADAINGYVSELNVYVGKQGIKTEKHLCEKVVKQLTRSLVNNYYTVYCDNYFTTIQLFNDLYKKGIYACGTIRSNRVGYPDDLKKHLKKGLPNRGDYLQRQCGNMLFSLWQDNKPVSVLSTGSQPGEATVERRQKDATKSTLYVDFRVELAKKLIGDYNSRKVRGRPQAVCCYQPTHFNHFPMKAPKRSKCEYCYERKRELKWTQWRCETCSKYLCHTGKQDSDCFIKYHKK